MSEIPPLLGEDEYEDILDTLADHVIEACGESLDPEDDDQWMLNQRDHLEAGDLFLWRNVDKYDVIDAFRHTDEFTRGMQGFIEYGDDDRLNSADWADIKERASNGGGPAAYRKHAERLGTLASSPHPPPECRLSAGVLRITND